MPRKNEWASRYGAKRKAIDRAILAEAEAKLTDAGVKLTQTGAIPTDVQQQIDSLKLVREAVGRVFGR